MKSCTYHKFRIVPAIRLSIFLLMVICYFNAACSRESNAHLPILEPVKANNPSSNTKLVSQNENNVKRAILTADRSSSLWTTEVIKIADHKSLHYIQFHDDTHGWVASDRILYKTSDRGKKWERIFIKLQSHIVIGGFFFVNPSIGWIMLRNSDESFEFENKVTSLFQTKDGGRTWRKQIDIQGLEFNNIIFLNDKEGWLTGNKYYLGNDCLILYTDDQGEHWQNVTGELNQFGIGTISKIVTPAPQTLFALTLGGNLVQTINRGQSWQLMRNEAKFEATRTMGKIADLNWIAGGAKSIEGNWGMVATKRDNGSWTQYKLWNEYFADGAFLTEQTIIACGSIIAASKNNQTAGAIFFSSDGGQTWSIIYQSKDVETINALTVGEGNQVWAVGDKGIILHLRLSGKLLK